MSLCQGERILWVTAAQVACDAQPQHLGCTSTTRQLVFSECHHLAL